MTPLLSDALRARLKAASYRPKRPRGDGGHGTHLRRRVGASVEFSDHRPYVPGDDPRRLDWRAYARSDRHIVKQFEQETKLTHVIAIDRSRSMCFPDPSEESKARRALQLVAALAYVLTRQGDKVEVWAYGDTLLHTEAIAHPSQIEEALGRIDEREHSPSTSHAAVAEHARLSGRRHLGLFALVSDLLGDRDAIPMVLEHLRFKATSLAALQVLSADELDLPLASAARVFGLEEEPHVDIDPVALREAYREEVEAFRSGIAKDCAEGGARYIDARLTRDPALVVLETLAP